MDRVRRLSNAAKLNVAGLILTAAGKLLQIAAVSGGAGMLRGRPVRAATDAAAQ